MSGAHSLPDYWRKHQIPEPGFWNSMRNPTEGKLRLVIPAGKPVSTQRQLKITDDVFNMLKAYT